MAKKISFLCAFLLICFVCARAADQAAEPLKSGENQATPEKTAGKENKKMVVNKGDKIKVQYEGKLTDGSVFDKSKEGKPLEFTAGAGQMIKGFDKAVIGMKLDEEKTINIKPEEAYGKRDETMVTKIPKSSYPKDFKPVKGMQIGLRDANGNPFPATITEITDEGLTVDLNHFLAGKELIFKIKIVSIE